MLLKTFAPWLLLAFLGQQVSLSYGVRNKNRAKEKTVTTAPGRGQRSGNEPSASGRGKFSIKDKMQCTWAARGVGQTVKLSVKCEDLEARVKGGDPDLQCQYRAKPQSCPGYQSDNKGFWKQVASAFRRQQGKVCKDGHAPVRIAMCKRAARETHFKLDILSIVSSNQTGEPETTKPLPPRSVSTAAPRSVSTAAPRSVSTAAPRSVSTAAPAAGPTACTGRARNRKTAEENCSGSWVSVCNFFLSMLQSDDC